MISNCVSKSISGHILMGSRPVRFIFVDEAGTSEPEPVTVVAGVIANADEHIMVAEKLVHECIGAVPPALKDNFVFHATDVLNNHSDKYSDKWSITDRLKLLKNVMSVPRRTNMAISFSVQWRGKVDHSKSLPSKLRDHEKDHLMAFANCLALADRNIRDKAGAMEIATVVCEDCQDMRQYLKKVPDWYKKNPIHLGPKDLRWIEEDERAGYLTQSGDMRIERIRGSVHFVEKDEDPLVQVADACAFGIRRFFAGQKFGRDFVEAIFGYPSALEHFKEPGGAMCSWWQE